jgi:hypothetical protein
MAAYMNWVYLIYGDPKSPESVTAAGAKSLGQEGAAVYAPTLVVFPNLCRQGFCVSYM